jgi:hypothetical protein
MGIIEDTSHWQNLLPPLCPNDEEISLYKKAIDGRKPVYLLGMTKQLLDLCDLAIDLNPIQTSKPTLKMDWNDLKGFHAGVIIGDGVMNLVQFDFSKLATLTNRFVCRVFLRKHTGMKYATMFPNEFPNATSIKYTQDGVALVVWDFNSGVI